MFHTIRACPVHRLIALFALFLVTSLAHAQSVSTPGNVSALIYSNSAVELFWTPPAGSVVEVTRNGELLGSFDSRSLYQSGLEPGKQYSYTLRSVDNSGRRSVALRMELNTANFSSPDQRIFPVGGTDLEPQTDSATGSTQTSTSGTNTTNDSSLSAPNGVSAFIYSSSSAELFWTPQPNSLVEVSRNGEILGRFGSRSLYQPDLLSGKQYRYILESLDDSNRRSDPVTMVINTANFSRPDLRIFPIENNDDPVTPEINSVEPEVNPESPVTPVVTVTELTNEAPVIPTTENPAENNSVTQTANSCTVNDVGSLLSCVRNADAYQKIALSRDITCGSNCCPNGNALVTLNGTQNLEFTGNGHRLLRTSGHRQCGLVDIINASNLRINNVYFDDDKRVGGCQVADRCPRMIHVRSSNNIRFDRAHISHGKGYAFYVQGTDGFGFENSTLHNSGVLGMYIGHGDDASSNVRISGSTFTDNQTNGLAIRGMRGSALTSNLVADNVFLRNHRLGQWAVAPQFGTGFTGGGQLYIAQASSLTVRNNIVKDGYCENCFVQRRNRSGVSGIEIGLPNQASVTQLEVSGNLVSNLDGFGISQNANSVLSNVSILNNQLLNTTSGEHVTGAQKAGNRVINTQRFDSFEAGNDVGSVFQGSVSCSANGSVARRCGTQSRFGECAVQLSLGVADCDNPTAQLLGPRVALRAGQSAVADGWVQNPLGRWCLLFRDSSGNELSEQCRNLNEAQRSDIQSFVGMPGIDTRSPAGSATVQISVSHSQAGASMLLDDIKLSVGD